MRELPEEIIWLRVSIPADFQYKKREAAHILDNAQGVGTLYIDMDTFNVEGLWACFKELVPESNHLMTVKRSDHY